MKFSVKKAILLVSAVAFAVMILLFRSFFTQTPLGLFLLFGSGLGLVVVVLVWWRCPHCNSYLWKLSFFAKHCPFCGKELDE